MAQTDTDLLGAQLTTSERDLMNVYNELKELAAQLRGVMVA